MAIKVRDYLVTLQHDGGTAVIEVKATCKASAVNMVQKAEHCPLNAIKKVHQVRSFVWWRR